MDNTAGCQLYLGKESLGASITTAKSSEINVLVPGAEPDGDWVRCLLSFLVYVCERHCLNIFLVSLYPPLLSSLYIGF